MKHIILLVIIIIIILLILNNNTCQKEYMNDNLNRSDNLNTIKLEAKKILINPLIIDNSNNKINLYNKDEINKLPDDKITKYKEFLEKDGYLQYTLNVDSVKTLYTIILKDLKINDERVDTNNVLNNSNKEYYDKINNMLKFYASTGILLISSDSFDNNTQKKIMICKSLFNRQKYESFINLIIDNLLTRFKLADIKNYNEIENKINKNKDKLIKFFEGLNQDENNEIRFVNMMNLLISILISVYISFMATTSTLTQEEKEKVYNHVHERTMSLLIQMTPNDKCLYVGNDLLRLDSDVCNKINKNTTNVPNTPNTPNTSNTNNILLYSIIGILALGIIVLYVLYKKKDKNKTISK